ncbi:MAG TPA: hypothetical protein VIL42_10565 [Sphingomicrobium sp.]
MSADRITDRMDAAFERARWRFPGDPPKAIYLSGAEWAQYDDEVRETWPSAVRCFAYRDVQIRSGNRSRLVTKTGCLVAIPKRLSVRVRAAA